jgi:hypothetical protein
MSYSPLLYQRADTINRFSDVPILMYYEISHPREAEVNVRYTTIFTNEDGGTPSAGLMARWGRASDIEWTYEVRLRGGQIVEESYQGVSHETKAFKGARINGSHPLLGVASDNNNFSDQTRTNMLFALLPLPANLHESSRETIMDLHPWSYRIVAEELRREGKLSDAAAAPNIISDPRNYVYVDLGAAQDRTSMNVEAKSRRQSKSSLSDLGDPKLRIERSGYFRTAIRMNSPDSVSAVFEVAVHCFSDVANDCKDVEIKSVSFLSKNYEPQFFKIQQMPKRNLKPGETLTIAVGPAKDASTSRTASASVSKF